MYRFQLNHNALETRPYPILADKKGNIIGIWQKHYRKVIGFSCLPQTGCVDVTFEQFTETKQSLRGMYALWNVLMVISALFKENLRVLI